MAGFGVEGSLPPEQLAVDGRFQHEYVHCRGLRLHVATAGDPDAPLVMCLHSAFGGWFDYLLLIDELVNHGFRVAAVDLRGFGLSDKPPAGRDLRSIAGDVSSLISALSTTPATVLGAGAGGTIAWTVAAYYPAKVAALITIAAAHPADMWHAAWRQPWSHATPLIRGAVLRLPAAFVARKAGLLAHLDLLEHAGVNTTKTSPPLLQQAQLRRLSAQVAGVPAAMVSTARFELARIPRLWANKPVSCPVLSIHQGNATWAAIARQSKKRAPDFTECTTLAGRHLPHMLFPEATAAVIADFLHRRL
ncbi:alpha/beta fold hydrolase [Corynebacterium choanae]|uniref:alpha/beta fold hydrolase n=1 Tax=Corynebacterium choanae TaxID=1862358 RepID=UPI0013DDE5BC|nr:alpha/beta hydrolase [Corynebacterium choanae]